LYYITEGFLCQGLFEKFFSGPESGGERSGEGDNHKKPENSEKIRRTA
jgi:hypothetical protein